MQSRSTVMFFFPNVQSDLTNVTVKITRAHHAYGFIKHVRNISMDQNSLCLNIFILIKYMLQGIVDYMQSNTSKQKLV